MVRGLLMLCLVVCLCGCTTLTPQERERWAALSRKGEKPVRVKNSRSAAVLNILPGVGNAYLALGEHGPRDEWLWVAINAFTWPVSIVWAVPDGARSARAINIRHRLALEEQAE